MVTLVVANHTAVSDPPWATLKAQVNEDGRQHVFIVVVPQERQGRARRREGRGLGPGATRLDRRGAEGLNVPAGLVGDPSPDDATLNALQFYHVDEVVISTLPEDPIGAGCART